MQRQRLFARSGWPAVAFGAAALVVLGVAAFFLHHTQVTQRSDLRERYADRTVVARGLLDSLFAVAISGQTPELSRSFSGARVERSAVERRVRASDVSWGAVLDDHGRVLAASQRAPRVDWARVQHGRFLRRATGRSGYALGDVLDDAVVSGTGFPTPAGRRVFVSGTPIAVYATFLQGTLRPLPGVRQARAYVFDGRDQRLGVTAQRIAIPPRTPILLGALRRRPSGSFQSPDTGRRFYASEHIGSSDWRIVVTVPESVLYESASGSSRALPWVILAISALALLGVALLLRRLLQTAAQLRATNAQLENSNVELARSNSDLEQFAYVASHDLSEPLRTVAGFSQLIGQRYRGRLDAEADLFIDHMSRGVARMQRLIDDLLLYSRVGRTPAASGRVDLDEVLGDVLGAIEPAIGERGAQITSDDLPTVRGEAGQLRQVLQNLIVNAVKFTAPDVTPRVHIAAVRADECWQISVRDNGIGVDPGQRETVFKMFNRLHPMDDYPGTGIGLALVRRIVERHGGRVWIDAAPDGGSVFSFTLPDQAHDEPDGSPSADPRAAAGARA